MWITKKLLLASNTLLPAEDNVLSRSQLQTHRQALHLQEQARRRAEKIIADAHHQAKQLIKEKVKQSKQHHMQRCQEYQQQLWQQASQLLNDWQQQKQQWQESLLIHADQLLHATLQSLWCEIAAPQRQQALLRLLASHTYAAPRATLYCAPGEESGIADWLQQHGDLHWQLNTDKKLPAQRIKLVTEQGQLTLDWQHLLDNLLPVISANEDNRSISPLQGTASPLAPLSEQLTKEHHHE